MGRTGYRGGRTLDAERAQARQAVEVLDLGDLVLAEEQGAQVGRHGEVLNRLHHPNPKSRERDCVSRVRVDENETETRCMRGALTRMRLPPYSR